MKKSIIQTQVDSLYSMVGSILDITYSYDEHAIFATFYDAERQINNFFENTLIIDTIIDMNLV